MYVHACKIVSPSLHVGYIAPWSAHPLHPVHNGVDSHTTPDDFHKPPFSHPFDQHNLSYKFTQAYTLLNEVFAPSNISRNGIVYTLLQF